MPRRIRQHVNPLAARYLEPRAEPVAPPAHLGPHPPTEVELGCADGDFSFELAAARRDTFVVGLEIRDKMVARARARARRAGLRNLTFAYVNLQVDMDRVFPPASVDRFHLLFPDPWFKARHGKRRVMGTDLVRVLARQLRPGGEIHVASDVFDIALEAMAELEAPVAQALGLRNLAPAGPWSFWRGNPFPAASRRERLTLRRGQRVWRVRYGLGAG